MPGSWRDAPTYGEAVRRVLEEHGLTFRGQRARTALPHSTVAGWVNDGIPPSAEKARQFAEGFGLPLGEWLTKAGYSFGQLEEKPSEAFWVAYGDAYTRMQAEGIDPILPTFNEAQLNALTPDEAREEAAAYERRSRERHAEKGSSG